MKNAYLIIYLFSLLSISACKHEHPPASKELIQAYEIQKEGLTELIKLESVINANESTSILPQKSKLQNLKNSMIEIEGMQHDHSQCNGDHSKKRFSIPDSEMIKVQSEWRDSILSVKKQLATISNAN